MVTPPHSKGVGGGPGSIGEGDAAGEAVLSPARLQPHLGVRIPSLWQVGQRAGCPVLAYQLHRGTSIIATSDYNSCGNRNVEISTLFMNPPNP